MIRKKMLLKSLYLCNGIHSTAFATRVAVVLYILCQKALPSFAQKTREERLWWG